MMGAFYAKKLFTHYAPMLDRGEISISPWSEIVEKMQSDIADYGVTILAAYNLGFDRRVMRQTNKLLGNGKPICPKLNILDLWQFACETKLHKKVMPRLPENWVGFQPLAILKLARNSPSTISAAISGDGSLSRSSVTPTMSPTNRYTCG